MPRGLEFADKWGVCLIFSRRPFICLKTYLLANSLTLERPKGYKSFPFKKQTRSNIIKQVRRQNRAAFCPCDCKDPFIQGGIEHAVGTIEGSRVEPRVPKLFLIKCLLGLWVFLVLVVVLVLVFAFLFVFFCFGVLLHWDQACFAAWFWLSLEYGAH